MNTPVQLCKFCHGTGNGLAELIFTAGTAVIVDPARTENRFRACGCCGGTGMQLPFNIELVELARKLALLPLEFTDMVDDDGVAADNPDYDDTRERERREELIRTSRELLKRLHIPLRD